MLGDVFTLNLGLARKAETIYSDETQKVTLKRDRRHEITFGRGYACFETKIHLMDPMWEFALQGHRLWTFVDKMMNCMKMVIDLTCLIQVFRQPLFVFLICSVYAIIGRWFSCTYTLVDLGGAGVVRPITRKKLAEKRLAFEAGSARLGNPRSVTLQAKRLIK